MRHLLKEHARKVDSLIHCLKVRFFSLPFMRHLRSMHSKVDS
jgi:hypothetical protein